MSPIEEMKLSELLERIGSKTPTPGGGAVASIVTALAAALARMVVAYSHGKKKLAAHEPLHAEALEKLSDLSRRAMELAETDAQAYAALNELWKLDEQDERRQREWAGAVDAAIDAPIQVLATCVTIIEWLEKLAGKTNPMLNSDLAMAAILAEAGARSAAWNVRINLPLLKDDAKTSDLKEKVDTAIIRVRSVCRTIEQMCSANAG
jgi:methenyltetrahydrofolate cyclohydrolase